MAAPVAIQLAGAMEIAAAGGGSGGPKTPTSPVSPTGGMGMQQHRMPSPFVNLNVREVFEAHGLDHTKEISKKVNVEIEKKREELRTLVGERYRDLIDAADTIASMSSSSADIFKKLGNLRLRMNTLPTQLNAIPKPVPQVSSADNKVLSQEELEIAFELKLSLEAPRVIQKCLDENRVIVATHISLLFDKSLCQSNRPYKWAFLYSTGKNPSDTKAAAKTLILKACDAMMEDFMTPSEKLAECIAAKQVLTNQSCSDVIVELLSKRIEMSRLNLTQGRNQKEFVQHIAKTLQDIYIIFIDSQLYNNAVKDMRRPKISTNLFGIKHTPKAVETFNVETISVEDSPRASELAQLLLKDYVEPLKLLLNECFNRKQYLSEQQSFQELNDYQQETLEVLKNSTEGLMRIVLGTSKSLWSEAFYPVFQKKCEQVGQLKLDKIFAYLDNDAYPNYKKLDEEFSLVDYIWKPSSSLKGKAKAANPPPTFTSNKDVDLKLKCISPQIAGICGEVELKFVDLMKDFKALGDFSLKKYISSKILEAWKGSIEKHEQSPCLFLGRFVASLSDLCPTIWKLMDMKDSTELRGSFVAVSETCWKEWSKHVAEKFSTSLNTKMGGHSGPSVAVFMPVAEVFTPEGEDAVAPSVRVPVQISHLLHSNLFSICNDLSRVGPQSIPKRVREELRRDIGLNIVTVYKKLMDSEEINITPQCALQLTFDIKFCKWFHLSLKEQADPLLKQLQSIIDPFDMDIVEPRLKANLKRFLFETHLTIGLLFSEESHSFIAQNFKTKMNMSFPISNTYLKSPLPLLPV